MSVANNNSHLYAWAALLNICLLFQLTLHCIQRLPNESYKCLITFAAKRQME